MPRCLALFALIIAVASFGLGFWAYWSHGTGAADSAFQSLQMFHLHYHAPHDGSKPLTLEVARFGAACFGLGLLPAMLGVSLFRGDWRRFCARHFWGGQVVVCGHCSRTLSLLKDLRTARPGQNRQRVVFVGHCPSPFGDLPPGVVHLEGNAETGDLLQAAGVHRAARLVALNEDDRSNLEILIAAGRICEERKRRGSPLECFAHLQDTHLQSGLHVHLGDTRRFSKHLRIHLFNYYEIAARFLARSFPLPEALLDKVPLPEHYIIVGFGSFGQNVARKLVKMGQIFVHEGVVAGADVWKVVPPRVTVIDPQGETAAAPFLRTHETFEERCQWQLLPLSCESPQFLNLSFLDAADAPARTSIIFCLENETVSLRTALLLHDFCRKAQRDKGIDALYLRLAHPERLGDLITRFTADRRKPALHLFAPDSDIFSADAIFGASLDALARAIHDEWLAVEIRDRRDNNQAPAAGRTWEDLSEQDQESNREAADHMWAKLRTLGYELHQPVPGEPVAPPDPALLAELMAREDELARVEHYRWMTWRWLDGWRFGPVRTSMEDIESGKPKFHPDMVPYEQLDNATKERDKVNIRVISRLLREGRLSAVKKSPPPS